MTPETAIKLGAIALLFLGMGVFFIILVFMVVRGWRRTYTVLDTALTEEYGSLLTSGELVRQTGVGPYVRLLTGRVDNQPVRVELLLGYHRLGRLVSSTSIIVGEGSSTATWWEATAVPSWSGGMAEVLKVFWQRHA